MRIFRLVAVFSFILALSGCGGPAVTTYGEQELPAAVPAQFQGWWKGKSEWDHLNIAADGMMRSVVPQDLQAAFNPVLTTPNANSFLKVFRNQGDTLYAISKEQRYDRLNRVWLEPIYYYVTLHYDFSSSILTYQQKPCNLSEADMDKSAEAHIARLTQGACTITETSAGQKMWNRTTTYYRETVTESAPQ